MEYTNSTLVGISATHHEVTDTWGLSNLYELHKVHPMDGWSYVVSDDRKWATNVEQLMAQLVIAYNNIGRCYELMCEWDTNDVRIVNDFAEHDPTIKLPPKELAITNEPNPMNKWPMNLRSEAIQIYHGCYHPKYTEQRIIIVAGTQPGATTIKSQLLPRLKAGWKPGTPWLTGKERIEK